MTAGPRFLDEDHPNLPPAPSLPPAPGLPVAPRLAVASPVASKPPPPDLADLTRPVLLPEEPNAPTRLADIAPPAELPNPAVSIGTTLLIALGLGGLAISWTTFSLISFVLVQLNLSPVIGTLAAVCIFASLGLVAWGLIAELRAWRALAEVGRLRRVLSANLAAHDTTLAAAQEWLTLVAPHLLEAPNIEIALSAATSAAEIRALLRTRVAAPLEAKALKLGQRAAAECAAFIAVSPHKSWDGLIAGARGLRLIRQVAALYGVRPGIAVTISMLRHVAWTAASTAGMTALTENVVGWATTDAPFLKHIAGAVGGSAVEAVRIYRLARVAARSCCPLDG